MRLHELAKELGMTNQEVVDLCGVLGVPVKSHSSSLNEAYADMIRRREARSARFGDIIGRSSRMKQVFDLIIQAAPSRAATSTACCLTAEPTPTSDWLSSPLRPRARLGTAGAKVVVVDEDRSSASRELIARFDASQNFVIADSASSLNEIDRYLDEGDAWMALSIPAGYGERALAQPRDRRRARLGERAAVVVDRHLAARAGHHGHRGAGPGRAGRPQLPGGRPSYAPACWRRP